MMNFFGEIGRKSGVREKDFELDNMWKRKYNIKDDKLCMGKEEHDARF